MSSILVYSCQKDQYFEQESISNEFSSEFSNDSLNGIIIKKSSKEELKKIRTLQKRTPKVRSTCQGNEYNSSNCIEHFVDVYYDTNNIYFRAGMCFDPQVITHQLGSEPSNIDLNYRQIIFHAKKPNGVGWWGADGTDLDGLYTSSSAPIPEGCQYMYGTEHYKSFGNQDYGDNSWITISGDICGKTFHVYTQADVFVNDASEHLEFPTGNWRLNLEPTIRLKHPTRCVLPYMDPVYMHMEKSLKIF